MLKFLYSKPLPKDIAKDRLKLIMINDRDGITPYVLDIIKNEILTILVKYIDVDTNGVSVDLIKNKEFDNSGGYSSLVASIPLRRSSHK